MMNLSAYQNQTIAVALSGGVDSTVLFHRLLELQSVYGFSLCVVHCEHGIRGQDSLDDQAFVKTLCGQYGVQGYFFNEDCPALAARTGESLETAARNFRYGCFERLLDEGKADYIALAHHLGDQAETVLFRLCRGSGLNGAAAMREVNGRYLRPMLTESKESILAYAAAHQLAYREDATNGERNASRNVLRLDVLPMLETLVPGAKENLAAFARLAREDEDFLTEWSEQLIERVPPIDGRDSGYRVRIDERAPLFKRACLQVMRCVGLEKDYTARHLDALIELAALQTGARCNLPKGVTAVREYDRIAFLVERADEELPVLFVREGRFDRGRYVITMSFQPIAGVKNLRLDVAKLPQTAVVRSKRIGDSFEKFGGGRKPLKKYLVDQKISALEREGLPILAEREGTEVFAVLGVEIAKCVAVDEGTKQTLYLAIQPKED